MRVDLPGGLILRRVETLAEYDACVQMERDTWGSQFSEVVPAAILMVAQKIGGVTAGAFETSGQLAGFVFGMTGIRNGELAHWSDLLAVRPDRRDHGLGRVLKLFQRELLLPLGVRTMYWTFDPLVAKNAHLNLNRLGARPDEYVVDMYGNQTGSTLHGGTGTDRFVVAWDLRAGMPDGEDAPAWATGGGDASRARGADADDDGRETPARRGRRRQSGIATDDGDAHARARQARTPPPAAGVEREAPIVNAPDESGWPRAGTFPDAALVRVEIPADIHAVQREHLDLARAWRVTTRRALRTYLDRGYRVAALRGDGGARRWYILAHPSV